MEYIYSELVNNITGKFKKLPWVDAVALGGSMSKGHSDKLSDLDLYIFTNNVIPLTIRQDIVNNLGVKEADLNLSFWDIGDQWIDLETGIEVDIIYWNITWIKNQIDRVLVEHEASLGFSTCFWYTVLNSTVLFDRNGWFKDLQDECRIPYPEKLRTAIIAKNHPVLRKVIPSYFNQIKKAVERKDIISINHRVAALLASYFDVLFAVNRIPNPGEKKLLNFTLENCKRKPENLELHIQNVIEATSRDLEFLPERITKMLDNLDQLLEDVGIDQLDIQTLDDIEEK